jgi:hypothetical protein
LIAEELRPVPHPVILLHPRPGRIDLRAPSPDPSVPAGGRLLAFLDEVPSGYLLTMRTGCQPVATIEGALSIVAGAR